MTTPHRVCASSRLGIAKREDFHVWQSDGVTPWDTQGFQRAISTLGPSDSCGRAAVRQATGSRAATLAYALAAIASSLLFCASADAKLLLVAHRGASAYAPENTATAFRRAAAVVDFVEFDVASTKDGHLVVIHDSTVDRTTNGKGAVAELTLAQIQSLDAGSWYGAGFSGEKIARADEVVAAIQADAAPFLERKAGSVAQYVALLERQPLRPEGIVMSFDYAFVVELKKAKPEVQVGWLGSGSLTKTRIAEAVSSGVTHFVWSNSNLDAATVRAVHEAGALLFAWTVNDLGSVAALNALGVDGIITDLCLDFAAAPAFLATAASEVLETPKQFLMRQGRPAVLAADTPKHVGRTVEWRRAGESKVIGRGQSYMVKTDNPQSHGRYVATWARNGQSFSSQFQVAAGGVDNQLVNLSARMTVGRGESAGIVGIVVKSPRSSRFLLRAVGPSLAAFGIAEPVMQPSLTLFRRGSVIDAQGDALRIKATATDFKRNGAFPLTDGSDDVAIMKQLEGGAYSAHLSTSGDKPGVGLIEVYQDNTSSNWANGAVVNISIRGRVLPGSPVIGGFVVPEGTSQTMLVRAIGPTLARFGVAEPLRDPTLRIYDSRRTLVAENDDWWAEGDAALINEITADVGAFRIPTGRDAAVLVTLAPGVYSAVLSDASGAGEGIALMEIYAVSPELIAANSGTVTSKN